MHTATYTDNSYRQFIHTFRQTLILTIHTDLLTYNIHTIHTDMHTEIHTYKSKQTFIHTVSPYNSYRHAYRYAYIIDTPIHTDMHSEIHTDN